MAMMLAAIGQKVLEPDMITYTLLWRQHIGLAPDGDTHNSVVGAGGKARQTRKTLELRAEMQQKA